MPIHDQGYRRYRGGKAGGRAWLVIMKTGIRTMLGDRKFIVLLAAAWIQFLVRAVQFYIAANFSQAAVIAPKADTFRDFFDKQDIFVYILTVTLGSRLIAQDRRVNALQIYLSKPLTRAEDIFGKLGILASFLLFVMWVPAILLLASRSCSRATSSSSRRTPSCFQRSPSCRHRGRDGLDRDAGAVVALHQQPLRRHHVHGLIFFSLALYNVLRFITAVPAFRGWRSATTSTQLGDVIFRCRRTSRRRGRSRS